MRQGGRQRRRITNARQRRGRDRSRRDRRHGLDKVRAAIRRGTGIDAGRPGHFTLQHKGSTYHMTPVETTTGAVRLEDPRGGAVWLQVANKSMLMNQKIGQRLADDCKSEEQTRVAEAMKHAPPPSLLSGTPVGSVKP